MGALTRASQVIVLGEDERHQHLIRRYLYRLGYSPHDIRFEPLPSGRGCGEQWVRNVYADAVRAYRSRSARAKSGLIVAIDADTGEVERRLRQFRVSLEQANVPARSEDKEIVHLVPKRNVETWVLCLTGRIVDEITDYSRTHELDRLISRAAVHLFEWSKERATVPPECVPSLLTALPELTRLT
jgi:hypothetical protein